jgi:outer membrane protein assembly factor BamA
MQRVLILAMRYLPRQLVLACISIISCQRLVHPQSTNPPLADGTQAPPCRSAQLQSRDSGPEISIAGVSFSGFLQMPVSDQDQIGASITRRTFAGSLDQIKGETEERLRREWQNRGYFKVQVSSDAHALSNSNPAGERIALSVHIDEGPQYRLAQITFKNNRAVTNSEALRAIFAIKDGDIFSREAIAKGLESLRRVYGELGYINAVSVPETTFNDDSQTISIYVNIDEGKQFYVSNISITGADPAVLRVLPLKPGDIYNVRLVELFLQKHLPGAWVDDLHVVQKVLDERTGTVALTFDFRSCPTE